MTVTGVMAPRGGIQTWVAGAVTGRVDIGIQDDGKVLVAYRGSDEWYRVVGSAADMSDDQIVTRLTADGGRDRDGNPTPSRLN